mgnify:CR=1 FL=1
MSLHNEPGHFTDTAEGAGPREPAEACFWGGPPLPRDAFNKPVGKVASAEPAMASAGAPTAPALSVAAESAADAAHAPALEAWWGSAPAELLVQIFACLPLKDRSVVDCSGSIPGALPGHRRRRRTTLASPLATLSCFWRVRARAAGAILAVLQHFLCCRCLTACAVNAWWREVALEGTATLLLDLNLNRLPLFAQARGGWRASSGKERLPCHCA